MKQKIKINQGNKWLFLILFLSMLFIVSSITAWFVGLESSTEFSSGGSIAVIPVSGLILTEGSSSIFGEDVSSSTEIVKAIESASENPSIKAILFEINSPGGSPVASQEIAEAIKRVEKPTYSLIRDVGTSGAYWVASATDKIVANSMSITGSIGVISSYLEFSGLLDDYNVTYTRLVAGKYKDVGSPFKSLEYDERKMVEKQLNLIHDYFIKAVAENRGLKEQDVRKIATGMYYIGVEAKELGLVDELGSKYNLEMILKEDLNLTEVTYNYYEESSSFFDIFSKAFNEQSFFVGKGIGSQLVHESLNSEFNVRT